MTFLLNHQSFIVNMDKMVDVQISNVTTYIFTIALKTILCELQHVQIDMTYKTTESPDRSESMLDKFSIETLGLSQEETHTVK